jgi:hypothetical protein
VTDEGVDPGTVASEYDLGWAEIDRQIGGSPVGHSDALRQRFAAFLEPSVGVDDPVADSEHSDARVCGALVMRLGGAATTTVIATWMDWTMERSVAAVAELDRRLDGCGLRVGADAGGHLRVRERARLRARPRRLALKLLARLDDPTYCHALAHLVRGDDCSTEAGWMQPLLDLGVAILGPSVQPSALLAAAFAGVRRRDGRRPYAVEVKPRPATASPSH